MYLQKNKSLLSIQIFKKSFLIFILSRAFISILIYFFLEKYDSRFFTFTDLDFYNSSELNIFSPNYFYAKLVQLIGYEKESIHNLFFLALSSFLSILVVLPYLIIASRIFKNKYCYFFSILLGSHPYIVLYSLKMDSSLFPLLAISIFNFYIFNQSNKNYLLLISISSFCLLFRNSLLPFAILIYIFFFLNRKNFSNIQKIFVYISILIVSFILFSQFGYGIEYVNQNFGCYSQGSIENYLGSFLPQNVSTLLSYLFTPIVHLFLNLGAREAISIYCLNLPNEIASSSFLNIMSTLMFFVFHSYLVIKIFCLVKNNFSFSKFSLLFPFSILLPTFYGTAHMRYLLPLLPMLLLWQFISEDTKLRSTKYNLKL